MRIPFSKWHALGNDFLIFDGRYLTLPWEEYAPFFADRHFGLGCDQVLVATPSQRAPVMMRIYNQDGSEAEMCGNGIRAFAAHYLREQGGGATSLLIETLAGVYEVWQRGDHYRVMMGKPEFSWAAIGADPRAFSRSDRDPPDSLYLSRWPEPLANARIMGVGVGNPHLVVFLKTLEGLPLAEWGPLLEHDPAFPRRINVEFVEILSPSRIRVRVWERGAGATLACGTGATAAAIAAISTQGCSSPLAVELPGGTLLVEWQPDGIAYMEGPVTFVAEGTIHLGAHRSRIRVPYGV